MTASVVWWSGFDSQRYQVTTDSLVELEHLLAYWHCCMHLIYTSTFIKFCKNMHTMTCRRVLTSTPL
jgi:hypothetical protein